MAPDLTKGLSWVRACIAFCVLGVTNRLTLAASGFPLTKALLPPAAFSEVFRAGNHSLQLPLYLLVVLRQGLT